MVFYREAGSSAMANADAAGIIVKVVHLVFLPS